MGKNVPFEEGEKKDGFRKKGVQMKGALQFIIQLPY